MPNPAQNLARAASAVANQAKDENKDAAFRPPFWDQINALWEMAMEAKTAVDVDRIRLFNELLYADRDMSDRHARRKPRQS